MKCSGCVVRAPLHRCARTGAHVAAFFAGQCAVSHADFVAVIQERHARHREQRAVCQCDFALRQSRRHACGVVVAGDEIKISVGRFRFAQTRLVLVQEFADRRAGIGVEIALVALAAQRVVHVAQQHVVAVGNAVPTPIEIEIHVEAGGHRLLWPSPFRNERGFGEGRADPGEHVLPGADGVRLALIVLFDEAVGHIHAEAVCATGKPEPHDVHHRVASGLRVRTKGWLLPATFGVRETVVERRLAFEEVQDVGTVAGRFAADEWQSVATGDP